ncbi:MAG: ribose 5-phosphate isomerase B [Bacteroidota bacterium]|jgi:ribose 5-phosphate isomerase B
MKIAIGSDHAGFILKRQLIEWLESQNHQIIDFGPFDDVSVDYPDYAFPAAESVASKTADVGIIICGTGIGVSIVANKVKGIRAANCLNPEMARLAREHNNTNVLTLGARFLVYEEALEIITAFLSSEFQGGRHERRVEKIHSLTGC